MKQSQGKRPKLVSWLVLGISSIMIGYGAWHLVAAYALPLHEADRYHLLHYGWHLVMLFLGSAGLVFGSEGTIRVHRRRRYGFVDSTNRNVMADSIWGRAGMSPIRNGRSKQSKSRLP